MNECSPEDCADAVDRAIALQCDIINMSIQFVAAQPGLSILHAAIQRAVAANILVVASAGNQGAGSLIYPAAFDEVVSVGAVDIDRMVAMFSTQNGAVDLASVGVNVRSCGLNGSYMGLAVQL